MATCGIYEIHNAESGRGYFGSSKHVERRLQEHKRQLVGGVHHSNALQKAWDKYGAAAFTFKLLAVLEPDEQFSTEQRLVTATYENSYNMGKYVRAALKGRKHSPETLAKMRNGSRAGANSPNYGTRRTEATKALQSALKKGKPARNKGTKHTAEAKERIRRGIRNADGSLKSSGIKGLHYPVCRNGHQKTEENSYIYRGKWNCRVCRDAATARYKSKRAI